MLVSAASFATMSACGHALAHRCDWRIVALARAGVVLVVSAWLARIGGVRLIFRWPRTLWMRSLVGSAGLLVTFFALSRLPVATAVTLFNTFPIWVTLLAWPLLGERPSAAFALALASGIAGVVLIEHGKTASDAALPETTTGLRLAIAAALMSAWCTAVVMLGLHRLRNLHSLAIVVHFSGVAAVAVIAFMAATSAGGWPIDLKTLRDPVTEGLLVAVGAFASLGQIAMTRAFGLGRPQRLAVVGLAQVAFALGFDLVLWNYELNVPEAAGLLLVLAPVAWLLGRRKS
jgi:drug/metabolite transporter (DMT)-like permease